MSTLTLPLVAGAPFDGRAWFAARTIADVDPAEAVVLWHDMPVLTDLTLRWATDAEVRSPHVTLDLTSVAEVLFCSSVDRADHLSPPEIWTALERQLAACHCELALCEARLAQEAGDHPDESAARMLWCLELAAIALNPFGGAS